MSARISALSAGSEALLRTMTGDVPDPTTRAYPKAMGPTLVKIRDPLENAEIAVELLDETNPKGRSRNRNLERRRNQGLQVDRNGTVTYNGRACCAKLAMRINSSLHIIAIPSEFACECGAVYRVEQSTREERRHVW